MAGSAISRRSTTATPKPAATARCAHDARTTSARSPASKTRTRLIAWRSAWRRGPTFSTAVARSSSTLRLHQAMDEPGRLFHARLGQCPSRVQPDGPRLSRRRGHGEGGRGLKVAEAALNSAPLTWRQAANSAQNDENLLPFASRDGCLQLPRVFTRSARFMQSAVRFSPLQTPIANPPSRSALQRPVASEIFSDIAAVQEHANWQRLRKNGNLCDTSGAARPAQTIPLNRSLTGGRCIA